MEQFVSWYFLARQRRHTEDSIVQVARDGERLQAALKQIFPDRAGTREKICFLQTENSKSDYYLFLGSSLSWAFPKFHAIRHVPRLLIMFGCWENVSTQVIWILLFLVVLR